MTQQDHPLGEDGGFVFRDELGSVRRVGVLRAHLEEDAGRIVRGAGVEVTDGECLVDLNRAGVPLLEVVLAPELGRAGEAAACLRALRRLLRHLGVADCVLEQGGFRCDVNVSLSGGEVSGTRTEIKNLNSYRFVAQAIEREVERQSALLDAGEVVESQTLGYDPDGDRIVIQRSKEAAREYLFLPEPDQPPVLLDPGLAARVGAALPERPHEQALRYERDLELPGEVVQALQDEPERVRVFEATLASGAPPEETARLVLDVLAPLARERGLTLDALSAPGALDPRRLAALCTAQAAGELRAGELPQLARVLLDESAVTLAGLLDRRELSRRAQPGPGQLEQAVQETLDEHPELVAAWRAGRTAVLNPLVGAARARLGGVGDPRALQERLRAALGGVAPVDPDESPGDSPDP